MRNGIAILGGQFQLSHILGQFTSLLLQLGLQGVPILARAVIAGKRTDDVDDREVPLLLVGVSSGAHLAGVVDGHLVRVTCTYQLLQHIPSHPLHLDVL